MIGDRLREGRSARRLSLSDVAAKADISAATLSRIENGKQGLDVNLFLLLLKILRMQPSDIFGDDGNSSGDRLVDQISRLTSEDRIKLWNDLAASRRLHRNRRANAQETSQGLEELIAQTEYLREELEAVRMRRRR